MRTLFRLYFVSVLFVFVLVLTACSSTQSSNHILPPKTLAEVLAKLETLGIVINLPRGWSVQSEVYTISDGKSKTFVCDMNLQLRYPTAETPRTYLSVCVSTDNGEELDTKAFVKGAQAEVYYSSNVKEMKHGGVEPFRHTDSFGREWEGFQYVSELHGVDSRGPFIENAVNVFIPWNNYLLWFNYFVPISTNTEVTESHSSSRRLSVFDYVSIKE